MKKAYILLTSPSGKPDWLPSEVKASNADEAVGEFNKALSDHGLEPSVTTSMLIERRA